MISYQKQFVTCVESWYSPEPIDSEADIAFYFQIPEPLDGSHWSQFETIWIDLCKSEEELVQNFSKRTRNEVRRAAKEGFKYDWFHGNVMAQVDSFYQFFETHSQVEQSMRAVRLWARAHGEQGTLDLSRVSDADGNVLVWHAYYRDEQHARLRFSVKLSHAAGAFLSPTIVGRAHRYLHLQDIKRFKGSGVSIYDLGGWYVGGDDVKLLGINQFKQGFGGDKVTCFHCTKALSIKGQIYLWASDVRKRLLTLKTEISRQIRACTILNYQSRAKQLRGDVCQSVRKHSTLFDLTTFARP